MTCSECDGFGSKKGIDCVHCKGTGVEKEQDMKKLVMAGRKMLEHADLDASVKVNFTLEQKTRLTEVAAKRGLSLNAFLRSVALAEAGKEP